MVRAVSGREIIEPHRTVRGQALRDVRRRQAERVDAGAQLFELLDGDRGDRVRLP